MHLDGFYKTFLRLDDFVPVKYEDYIRIHSIAPPMLDFIDRDMIFKHSNDRQYFVFNEKGKWNEETANLEDFDFRNCINEFKWIDKQINE